jgi:hypothetical protein
LTWARDRCSSAGTRLKLGRRGADVVSGRVRAVGLLLDSWIGVIMSRPSVVELYVVDPLDNPREYGTLELTLSPRFCASA